MSVFSTDAFLHTVAELYHPGRRASVEVFSLEGRALRLLVLDGHEVVTTAPFYDFVMPLERWAGPTRPLAFVPRTVVKTVSVDEPLPQEPGVHPSPYVDWSRFAGWGEYERYVTARRGNLLPDSRRRRNKAEKALGPLTFVFDDPRPEVFEACVRWKSAQYRQTGLPDLFALPENVELFRRLREHGVVVLSSLSAGATLLAAHLGGLADGQHTWWVPAYDPAQSKFSPGRLMLQEILRESLARKHREFDFLIGAEDYKSDYSTHARVIGPVGTQPLKDRVLREVTFRVRRALKDHPRLYGLARALKQRLAR